MKEIETKKKKLTQRDLEVIQHIANGLNDREISKVFNLTYASTRTVIKSIMDYAHIEGSRTALVSWAYKNGILKV